MIIRSFIFLLASRFKNVVHLLLKLKISKNHTSYIIEHRNQEILLTMRELFEMSLIKAS